MCTGWYNKGFGFELGPWPEYGGYGCGLTPLLCAVRSEQIDTIKALLDAGADLGQGAFNLSQDCTNTNIKEALYYYKKHHKWNVKYEVMK